MGKTKNASETYTPDTDPVNRQGKTERGWPARLHMFGGEIHYYKTESARNRAVIADRGWLRSQERMNWPWWKRKWHNFKVTFLD